MYLIQYSEAAERLGWNVKGTTRQWVRKRIQVY